MIGLALKLRRNSGNQVSPAHPSASNTALLPYAALVRVRVRNGQVYNTNQVLDTFRDMLERNEIKVKDVAEEIGVFASNLSMLTLRGQTHQISREKMILLANYVGFSERVE